MAEPIGYNRILKNGVPIDIPIYNLTDVSDNSFRVRINGVTGCYKLIAADSTTPLRVFKGGVIKGVDLSTAPPVNLLSYADRYPDNVSIVTIVSSDDVYTQIRTTGNGHGLRFPVTSDLEISKTYTVKSRVEILGGVDDVTTIHVRNITQNKYIGVTMALSTFQLNTIQDISATFSPSSANYTVGDVVEVWIYQSWKNSTHDNPFEWRIYNEGTVLY